MANKMIVKGISFNPENSRHMELLQWIEKQSNFSSFAREILGFYYEMHQQKQTFQQLEQNTNMMFDDLDIDLGGMK